MFNFKVLDPLFHVPNPPSVLTSNLILLGKFKLEYLIDNSFKYGFISVLIDNLFNKSLIANSPFNELFNSISPNFSIGSLIYATLELNSYGVIGIKLDKS